MDGNIDKVREDIERLLEAANRNVGGMVPGVIATWCHKALAALSAEPAQDDGKPEGFTVEAVNAGLEVGFLDKDASEGAWKIYRTNPFANRIGQAVFAVGRAFHIAVVEKMGREISALKAQRDELQKKLGKAVDIYSSHRGNCQELRRHLYREWYEDAKSLCAAIANAEKGIMQ